jgi:MFS family permease
MQVPGYILEHTNIKDEKIWHFYLLLATWASIYTTMNVSVVLFLQEALGDIFLAGFALSIGSMCSMFFDGIFSYLQKVYTSRNLFLVSIIGMILAVSLFLFPISITAYLAAIFFRISFDLCDITAISYILSKSLPAEYGQNLSYKQLAQGIGMIGGFIISAVLMQASYFIGEAGESLEKLVSLGQTKFLTTLFFIKIFLLVLLLVLWFLAYLMFDKKIKKFDKEFLFSSFQKLEAETLEGFKGKTAKIVKGIPGKLKQEPNQIKLRNTEEKENLDKTNFLKELFTALKDLKLILTKKPFHISLLWSILIMGIFSYWDTFLGTFLPIFFTEILKEQSGFIQNLPGSILMLIFILPVLGFLPVVAKWGDKYGRYYFMLLGLIITIISTFLIFLFYTSSFLIILIAGFGIAFGYLFAMSTAKAQTASLMNEFFAVEKQKAEIDSNASSGPIMLIDNMGNIFGPLIGSAIISLMGFRGFFMIFSLFLGVLLFFSLKNLSKITGHNYVFHSPIEIVNKDKKV